MADRALSPNLYDGSGAGKQDMNGSLRQTPWVLLVILGSALLLGQSACVTVREAEAPSVPPGDSISLATVVPSPLLTIVAVAQPASEAIPQQQTTAIRQTENMAASRPPPAAEPAATRIWAPTATSVTEPAPDPTAFSFASTNNSSIAGTGSDYYISGFACTGSMRPTLDCGDEADFLKPPPSPGAWWLGM